jgi:DNA primase
MQNWIDFTAIKQTVGLAPLLRRYQVSLRRSGRDQYRGLCPIHRGQGRDAFHVNLSRNLFHCFSCGAGGSVLDLVAAMEGCTVREAACRLLRATSLPGPSASLAGPPKTTVTRKSSSAPLGFALRGIDTAHPYLAARGVQSATAQEFGIGFYRGPGILSGRLVIPIHNAEGVLVAYCGRAVDRTEPRYRFPSGFAKSDIVFNLHRAAAPDGVVVVEGFFDCLRLHQAGTPAVALMGTALSAAQQHALLRSFRNLILMLDGDEAGRRATETIAARLRSYTCLRVVHLPDAVQPDQLSTTEIEQILQSHSGLATPARVC